MQHLTKPRSPTSLRFQKLTIPFVHTSPIADLGLLLAIFPLWWILGIEQFIWPIGLAAISLKVVTIQQQKIRVVVTLKWLFLFLIIHLLSGLFIVESFRLITFVRNFGAYVTAFLVLFVITNQVRSWREIRWLLAIMTGLMCITATVGFLGILGIWRPSFTSLTGVFLPAWIRNTSYGGQIAVRSIGRPSWFAGLNTYFRVFGFFMFSTLYASVLAFSLPMMFFLFSLASTLSRKILLASGSILIIVNLVYTTGRIAIISCLVGAGFYLVFYAKLRTIVRLLAVFLIVCAMFVTFLSAYSAVNVFSPVTDLYQDLLFARGPGSFADRSTVYMRTLEGVLERPLLGWGTERDIPDFPYPAGSHSHYLAILYKQGIVGFLVFLGMYFSLWKETSVPMLRNPASSDQRTLVKFLQFGRWTIVTALVNSLTDVLDLDATTMMFLWTIFALLIQARRLIARSYEQEQLNHVAE